MEAVVLVDLQYDFLPGGALAVPEGDRVLPVADAMARAFDLVVATQDWHPPDHGSFVTSHPGRRIGDRVLLAGLEQVVWPPHCVQQTHGAELHESLPRERISRVFRKGVERDVDSYSGFFDNGRRRSTGLGEFLRRRDVDILYVLGLATDYCVRATALDARRLGFTTRLVIDGCRGVNLAASDSRAAVEQMRGAGVDVVESRRVVR